MADDNIVFESFNVFIKEMLDKARNKCFTDELADDIAEGISQGIAEGVVEVRNETDKNAVKKLRTVLRARKFSTKEINEIIDDFKAF